MTGNTLYYGDNLEILRRYVKDESVDLIYLDPPFNSNVDYNVLFKERDGTEAASQIRAFKDTWTWDLEAARTYESVVTGDHPHRVKQLLIGMREYLGTNDMFAYVTMMTARLIELRRVLKATGSLYLHCDSTASHYLKAALDAVFGPEQFRGEIVWKRHNSRSTKGRWPRLHDTLLFYSKGKVFHFEPQYVAGDPKKLPHTLVTGPDGKKYQSYDLTGAGVTMDGESGRPWRGYDPSSFGRHWAQSHTQMDKWDEQGLIHWANKSGKAGGFPRRRAAKPFTPGSRNIVLGDVWTDIDRINQSARERLGYPTQKPLALLERILRASSKQGDTVLDPFCGCGTTVSAAQSLGRRWIGIDITSLATTLIKVRLRDQFEKAAKFDVVGEPTSVSDAKELAKENPYQFQWWALGQVGARPFEQKKGSDQGVDGRLYFHDEGPDGKTKQVIFSVKAGKVSVDQVRDLVGVIAREKAAIGVFISLNTPSKPMRTEAASAGFYDSPWGKKYPVIQLLTIEEILKGKQVDMPPAHATSTTFRKAPKITRTPKANRKLSFDPDDDE